MVVLHRKDSCILLVLQDGVSLGLLLREIDRSHSGLGWLRSAKMGRRGTPLGSGARDHALLDFDNILLQLNHARGPR
jgi:hypothetical protein